MTYPSVGDSYHSAFAEPDFGSAEQVQLVEGSWGSAFVCDLARVRTLPQRFDACDLIYCEPPWTAAHSISFRLRAGSTDEVPAQQFLVPLAAAAEDAGPERPVVMVAGVEFGRMMPAATVERPIQLHVGRKGVRAKVFCYGSELPDAPTSVSLLRALVTRSNCVGDPMCGFGNTGREFVRAGKRAVLSDLHPRCIGYIASKVDSWKLGLV